MGSVSVVVVKITPKELSEFFEMVANEDAGNEVKVAIDVFGQTLGVKVQAGTEFTGVSTKTKMV